MNKSFHINKYGIPAVCHAIAGACQFGGRDLHFDTYEEAQKHIDKLTKERENKVKSDPIKSLDSYYQSDIALNEFQLNKQVSTYLDFDLMMISWASLPIVQKNMKMNKIGEAQYTFGDIIKILEQEIISDSEIEDGLHLKDRYLNGKNDFAIPHTYYDSKEHWEPFMEKQKELYDPVVQEFRRNLGYNNMEVMYLPMTARKLLEQDGYITDSEDINNVIYKISPEEPNLGDLIVYNHSTFEKSKPFDVYEFAGVIEGKTLFDFTHDKNSDIEFEEIWGNGEWVHNNEFPNEYKIQREVFRAGKFMKGIEGPDILKAFVKMSPIAAKEIAKFIETHKILMKAVSNILGEKGVQDIYGLQEDIDDFGWQIN